MLSDLLDRLLSMDDSVIYCVVWLLVFAEDALFVGFVFPGESAAILGGVAASLGTVSLVGISGVVVSAAILGDTVSYLIGRWLGARLVRMRFLRKRDSWMRRAQSQLAVRGGAAVFVGRFVTFFHAVMPALAGAARMPYRRFFLYNAAGGVVWGVATVLLGYLAGTSYTAVERVAGRAVAAGVALIVVVAFVAWRIRGAHRECGRPEQADRSAVDGPDDGVGTDDVADSGGRR